MSTELYNAHVLVLRKTPLGESDLIVTLLADNGSQLRCVAKGARKPSSSLSARLEVYSEADIHCARGKSLDIIKEARLRSSNDSVRSDIEHTACAAPIAELLDTVSQEGLEDPRLFALACAAFSAMGDSSPSQAVSLCAASLIKIMGMVGFKPSLDHCVFCGRPLELERYDNVCISDIDGGVVCDNCRTLTETHLMSANDIAWTHTFLMSTFKVLMSIDPDPMVSFQVLQFAQQWSRVHIGKNLKSLNFLFTCGLF